MISKSLYHRRRRFSPAGPEKSAAEAGEGDMGADAGIDEASLDSVHSHGCSRKKRVDNLK